jgi:hypothetical protein
MLFFIFMILISLIFKKKDIFKDIYEDIGIEILSFFNDFNIILNNLYIFFYLFNC